MLERGWCVREGCVGEGTLRWRGDGVLERGVLERGRCVGEGTLCWRGDCRQRCLDASHLDAVAVVDVPVEDEDAADVEAEARDGDGGADVVDQAETHRLVRLAVVARRAGDREGIAQLALCDTCHELGDGASRHESGVTRVGSAKVSVAVEPECLCRGLVARVLCRRIGHQLRPMNETQIVRRRDARRDELAARVEALDDDLVVDGDHACGALGMRRLRLVQQHWPHTREQARLRGWVAALQRPIKQLLHPRREVFLVTEADLVARVVLIKIFAVLVDIIRVVWHAVRSTIRWCLKSLA